MTPTRGHTPGRLLVVATLLVVICSGSGRASGTTRNLLWRATSATGVVYLVGSLHVLSTAYYPLNPAIDAAFDDSRVLVEEVDMGVLTSPNTQLEMLRKGLLPSGQTLQSVVSPATYALVRKRLLADGVDMAPLSRFKPWMVTIALSGLEWQRAGLDPSLGVDVHFYDRAKAEGKAVQGLETVDFQLSRFDTLSAEEQDRLLVETLDELDTETTKVTELADLWKAGDATGVERLVLADLRKDPTLYERLLLERNRNWLPQVEALLAKPAHAFVVVGAAHLVGPDGLVRQLQANGYTVVQQ